MNWDRISGNWKNFKRTVGEEWGKLTDEDLDEIAGKRAQLVAKLQDLYGLRQDEAHRQIRDWVRSMERRRLAQLQAGMRDRRRVRSAVR